MHIMNSALLVYLALLSPPPHYSIVVFSCHRLSQLVTSGSHCVSSSHVVSVLVSVLLCCTILTTVNATESIVIPLSV